MSEHKFDAAFDKWWATKVAEGYQYGREPLSNVRFGFEFGFQAGAARRECAELAEAKGGEYEKLGDYGINQSYVRKVEAANEISAAILERVGKAVGPIKPPIVPS